MNLSALLPALLLSSGSSVSAVQPASSRWQRLGQITGPSICAMAISPAYGQDSTIWAGTPGYGLYDSTDGAGSWHAMHIPFARNGACVIAVSPTYASDHELATVTDRAYLSLDSGASWVDLGLPMTPAAIAFSPSFATDHTMLAVGDAGGIYRSIDGGAHWSNVADWQTGLPESAHFLVENLCFSPAGMVMIATGNGIYASRDSGATWAWDNAGLPLVTDHSATSLDSTPHVPAVSVSITGDAAHWRAYVAIRIQGHGSVFRSDDGTGAWTAAGGAIAALPSTLVAVAGSSQDTLLLGTDDRGLLQSNDGGTTWRSLDRGLSDRSVATILPVPGWPANPQLFLGESQDGVFQLDTLSGSWVRRFVGMPQTDAVSATAVVGTRIYAGMLSGLYRSASNGRTWSPTNTGLPGDRAVSDLAFTRGLGFVATGRGLFRSGTGARWSATGSPLMKGIAAYAVAARVVNNRVELAAGTENGLFSSGNGGRSWRMVESGDMNISRLAFAGNTLYALCSGQLDAFDGSRRSVVVSTLGHTAIQAFALSPASHRPGLVGSTTGIYRRQGRSWKRSLSLAPGTPPALTFIAPHVAVAGSGRDLFFTRNDGLRWTRYTLPVNDEIMTVLAMPSGAILLSTAGGSLWQFRV